MSDFSTLALDGAVGLLQGNVEAALSRVRKDVDAKTDGSYTPANAADWASPPPTTIAEALDRLAAANPGA